MGTGLILLFGPIASYEKLPLSVLLALLQVRLFAFFHDHLHGAVLRRSWLARVILGAIGTYLLIVPSVWRETHDYHHAHNSQLAGSAIGSFPIVSLATWKKMSRKQRLLSTRPPPCDDRLRVSHDLSLRHEPVTNPVRASLWNVNAK
jgi:fatty acid desaturase